VQISKNWFAHRDISSKYLQISANICRYL